MFSFLSAVALAFRVWMTNLLCTQSICSCNFVRKALRISTKNFLLYTVTMMAACVSEFARQYCDDKFVRMDSYLYPYRMTHTFYRMLLNLCKFFAPLWHTAYISIYQGSISYRVLDLSILFIPRRSDQSTTKKSIPIPSNLRYDMSFWSRSVSNCSLTYE